MPGGLRHRLLETAYQLLAAGEGVAPSSFSVVISANGSTLTYTATPEDFAAPAPPDLSAPERHILAAAGARPLTAKRLAAAARRKCNSYFRGVLRSLCRRGHLQMTPDGYRLPTGR